jgi:uncharacterized membrane protein
MATLFTSKDKKALAFLLSIVIFATMLSACGSPSAAENPSSTTVAPSVDSGFVNETPTAEINSNNNTSGSVAVSFSNDVLPLLQDRCVSCHGGEKTSRGLKLTSYENVMAGSNNGAMVIAGDLENSKLFQLVEAGKMPKRGGKLTDAQIEILKQWILAGAQNN